MVASDRGPSAVRGRHSARRFPAPRRLPAVLLPCKKTGSEVGRHRLPDAGSSLTLGPNLDPGEWRTAKEKR